MTKIELRNKQYEEFIQEFGIVDRINGRIMFDLICYSIDTGKFYVACQVHQRRKEWKAKYWNKYRQAKKQ